MRASLSVSRAVRVEDGTFGGGDDDGDDDGGDDGDDGDDDDDDGGGDDINQQGCQGQRWNVRWRCITD